MAQIIPLNLVLELTGSQVSDSISDSDQAVVHCWPGDPVNLDISVPPTEIKPVWIAVAEDCNIAKWFPAETPAADILAEGWAHLYKGTMIHDSDGNANVYSDQYNHVLLAIAACCNSASNTLPFALKQSNSPLTPGQVYGCGVEAIFKWLAVYGSTEDRPDLTVRFAVKLIKADSSQEIAELIYDSVFTQTIQLVKRWPQDFIGMSIGGVNLVANDTPDLMPGEQRVLDFDNGIIEVTASILDVDFNIVQQDVKDFALPSTQCGAGCIDPYPDPLTFPDATDGVAYNTTTQLEGTGPFSLEIVQKPAWLNASLNAVSGLITWSGTPPTFGNDQVIEFKAENCGEEITEATPSSGEILLDVKQVMTFTARTSPGNQPWYKVVYANYLGLFVAISQSNASGQQVATSPDGDTWTLRNTPGNINWNCIGVDEVNGRIVVMGTGQVGAIMYSDDAATWTAVDAPETVQARGVAYSPALDIWISVGSLGTNRILKSVDGGVTWTTVVAPVLNQWYGLIWSPTLNLFVATAINGTGNQVMTSPDGDTWTMRVTDATSRSWFYVSDGGGLLVATSASGSFGLRVMTSPDAIVWTLRSVSNINQNFSGSAYGNGMHVIVGNAASGQPFEKSADGISWATVPGPVQAYIGIAFGADRFVVVGTNLAATADWT